VDIKQESRRRFLEKAVYMAPVILTLQAAPRFAKSGSLKDAPPAGVPGVPDFVTLPKPRPKP
jgi:hypothetical protein